MIKTTDIVITCTDEREVIEAIANAARTGKIGDGKIFISEISEAIRIRTGETGSEAV